MEDERFWAKAQLEDFCGSAECCVDEFTGAVGMFGPFKFIVLNKIDGGYRGVFDFDRDFWTTLSYKAVLFE